MKPHDSFCRIAMKDWAMNKTVALLTITMSVTSPALAGDFIGRLGSNPFCADCSANEFAPMNNPFNPNSMRNRFGPYGNPFSPYSPYNRFATQTPAIYGEAPGYGGSDMPSAANEESDALLRQLQAGTDADMAREDARINAELGIE